MRTSSPRQSARPGSWRCPAPPTPRKSPAICPPPSWPPAPTRTPPRLCRKFSPTFRVYTNDDRRGTELGGAVKNVIALAVGIALGLGYGDNAKAALITRGNAELSRLGIAMGCKPETFAGLSGMGDLIVTCTSMHSRNLHAGMLIGRGKSVEDAKTEVGQVVEGINALPAACHLAKKYKVEMPIVQAVEAILDGKLEARNALMALMGRNLKRE